MTSLEFSRTINSLTSTLMPFALKLTKDRDQANDLLQDTFIKAFLNKDRFQVGTNLKAWLYTIMKNTFITNYQRMMRRATFVDQTANYHQLNSTQDHPERRADAKLRYDEIYQVIKELDEIYQVPFMMHYKGFKYHEIADRMDLPIGTVKNRIHVARKRLQKRLKSFID